MAVRAKEVHGCHVEVASNIVPDLNDDDASLAGMARLVIDRLGPNTPWHVTRFLPDFELTYLPPTPIKTLERGLELGKIGRAAVRLHRQRARTSGPRHDLSQLRSHCHPPG